MPSLPVKMEKSVPTKTGAKLGQVCRCCPVLGSVSPDGSGDPEPHSWCVSGLPGLSRNVPSGSEHSGEYKSGLYGLRMQPIHSTSKLDSLLGIGKCMNGKGEVCTQGCSQVSNSACS